MKMLSCLLYLQNESEDNESKGTLRMLEEHLLSEEEPFSFSTYSEIVGGVYRDVMRHLTQQKE